MMTNQTNTREGLLAHCRQYPSLQIRDVFKYLYQSSFGCEHLVSSLPTAIDYMQKEYAAMSFGAADSMDSAIDVLDGAYSRVHLSYLNRGLRTETLAKLFVASAKPEADGRVALEQKLSIAQALVREGKLPFSPEAFEGALEEWRALGYPAIHHSEAFRAAYAPAYRVISNEYLPFLPLFANIDTMLKTTNVVLAIEGGSASGKTTLSETFKMLYDCTVFHMDDFFLRPEQRTKERYAQIGGNVDRERFLAQVLLPLSRRQPVAYQRFDCSTMTLMPAQTVTPTKLTVIEGAYSMHPELAPYYHASVFLNVSPDVQRERIKKRNSPAMAERFFGEWIPLEERYFSQMQVAARCDMVIDIV